MLKKALKLPNLLITDYLDKKHMRDLIQDHRKACVYSRDGYEDIPEQAYTDLNGATKKSSFTPINKNN